ncbi:MAG TPA: DUF1499 domain-containing protein [Burkholderiales bacterium]|nr:DUF1499 domain-containing protein [Burkholderiales bacterium]
MTRWLVWLRPVALALAIGGIVFLAISGPFVRSDLWSYRSGFLAMRWSAFLGIAAIVASIVVLAVRGVRVRGLGVPLVALVFGVIAFYVPYQLQARGRAVPPINDISTDTANPPKYMTTSRAYPGDGFARQQREAYPDIGPVNVPLKPSEAFARAVAAAESMGWEVVGRDAAAGTMEAVDTTKWFGFKDDIAVRVTPDGSGSRIDVRSKSRVGRSDLGMNARRIRAYAERLK